LPARRAPYPWSLIMRVPESCQNVSGLTQRMMSLMLHVAGHREGAKAPGGLPAGAVYLPAGRLILASTSCMVPMFGEQMLKAAMATQSDVLLLRHGLFPEALDPAACDVVLYLGGAPALITDMLLYHHPEDGFWLVPQGIGPHIAIEPDGLRVAEEQPYIAWQSGRIRCAGPPVSLRNARVPDGASDNGIAAFTTTRLGLRPGARQRSEFRVRRHSRNARRRAELGLAGGLPAPLPRRSTRQFSSALATVR